MSGNLVDRLSAIEAARLEENKRFNTERQIMEELAPEKWMEMKKAFREECAPISECSHRFDFQCDDPTPTAFHVSRIINGLAVRVVTLRFDRAVPRIVFDTHDSHPIHGTVEFLVCGSSLVFANGQSGIVLTEFVVNTLMHVTRRG
jgi:hypothetical protein